MSIPTEDARRFDEGAKKARIEFVENWQTWKARDVADWMLRWRRAAAYDRLCRILIDVTGVTADTDLVEWE
jgi:hypothetical protein